MSAQTAFEDDVRFPESRPDWWAEAEAEDGNQGRPATPRVAEMAVPGPEVRYLNIDQAAAYLGVTVRMVRRLADEGRLAVSKVGKYRRFTREALDGSVEVVRLGTPPATSTAVPDSDPVARAIQRSMSQPPSRNGLRAVPGEG